MSNETFNKQEKVSFDLNICVFQKEGFPSIRLYRESREPEIIKTMVSAAMTGQPLLVTVKITDRLKALARLIEAGIIYQKENGEFYFTI